ncbi:Wall-associated receptor kinase, galacturonan-binding domain containing protein [Trema orientale]|uniref:Wall-associated receptor kinase, galacturonan-binding domain containing protein n=1 Tax=Trema orientale TaxID=63057 RepID=A0A2P5FW04_TREOI|nr:Wall-associated receptor kinase, galacturonan-binding domain containing protein [Trema orientale]
MSVQQLIVVLFYNCSNKCNNISSVHSPRLPTKLRLRQHSLSFRHHPDCYYNSFRLTCNHTFDPSKLVFHGSNIAILEISLDRSEIQVEYIISHDCYDQLGKVLINESSGVLYSD